MKVLVSPETLEEARAAFEGGADIIDVKNVEEGSLGANYPWVIREIVEGIGAGAVFSASIGDLGHEPGNAALAALGAVVSGARYVKAGLYGVRSVAQGVDVMTAVQRACKERDAGVTVVAAGYADWPRFGGIDPAATVEVAAVARCDVVMLDTAIKDGRTLFDALDATQLRTFVDAGHRAGLAVALAGSIRFDDIARIAATGADIVGVRGGVCDANDRAARIDLARVRRFTQRCRELASAA